MYIEKSVVEIIKYLCNEIRKEEWSGIIFYTVEGSIRDIKKMSITIKHFFPMHKGSSTFTEYELDDAEFVKFRMANMPVNFMIMGHMHSHNTMGAYFSGTDNEELHDSSASYNYYLSVIVNNYMDAVGRIAFRTKLATPIAKALDEEGNEYNMDTTLVEETVLSVVECEVKLQEAFDVPEFIKNRTAQIIETHAAAEKAKAEKAAIKPYNPNDNYYKGNGYYEGNRGQGEMFQSKADVEDEAFAAWEEVRAEYIDNLTKFIISQGELKESDILLDDVITRITAENKGKKKSIAYVNSLRANIVPLYTKFLENNTYAYDIHSMVEDLEDVNTELVDFEENVFVSRINNNIEAAIEELRATVMS